MQANWVEMILTTSTEGDEQLLLWEQLKVLEKETQQRDCTYPIPPVISPYSTWLDAVLL